MDFRIVGGYFFLIFGGWGGISWIGASLRLSLSLHKIQVCQISMQSLGNFHLCLCAYSSYCLCPIYYIPINQFCLLTLTHFQFCFIK